MSEETKILFDNLNDACNAILQEFSRKNEVSVSAFEYERDLDGAVWVNEETPVTMSEVVLMLQKGISFDEYIKYWDYDSECRALGLNTISFRSWIMGAPRYSKSFFDKIKAMREELEELAKTSEEEANMY